MTITVADVEAAAKTIDGSVARTPSAVSETLSEILGCTIVLKFENLQFTASFKERGARNRLAALSADERSAGVVAVSAGNHAQAVARHAKLLDIGATIVMPKRTPFVKVARTQFLGADVELVGVDLAEAMDRGHELVGEGRTLIHPYDDSLVMAGQGTVALELLDDEPELDAIVVPVGGGGLIAGVSVVASERKVDVVGVQSHTHAAFAMALGVEVDEVRAPTMAEGIGVHEPSLIAAQIVRDAGGEIVVVTESEIEHAVNMLLEIEKVVVEGAGAAGIAAIAANPDRFRGKRIGVVLTGGNIDPRLLASVIERGLVRSGRLARVRVELDDAPGALAALLSRVGEAGANIVEVQHQRMFADISVRRADVDLVVECQHVEHRNRVVAAIRDAGYDAKLLTLDS
ncbi:MAG: threonine ammonia-lyase [Actinomycetota bacterium]